MKKAYTCPECGSRIHGQLLDSHLTSAFCFQCKKSIDPEDVIISNEKEEDEDENA